jgi:hypothetical protein
MNPLYLVLVVLGAATAGACMWYGRTALKQAEVIGAAIPFSRLAQNVGYPVALRGKPRLVDSSQLYLWMKRTEEVYRTSYVGNRHSGGWHTVGVIVQAPDFELEGEGGVKVHVHSGPTEVHGKQTANDGSAFFAVDGQTRTLMEFLPGNLPWLTVCGTLLRENDRFAIRRDDTVGLLFSTRDPQSEAKVDAARGYILMFVPPLAWFFASIFSYRHFHPR